MESTMNFYAALRAFMKNENVKITAGAICAVVTVGLFATIAMAILWTPL
jgi:hypothetical protein